MKKWFTRKVVAGLLLLAIICGALSVLSPLTTQADKLAAPNSITHVVLISVDGMHAEDLTHYIGLHPNSTLAQLSRSGTTYTNASTSKPSDSFPGTLAMVTGGTPASTGVYYDDSYDRQLSAPGSDCSTKGTEVVYDESVDKDSNAIDGGGGIDPSKLPRDPANGCAPVYPHSFLRVNTIFEVIKAAGLRTAWSDKHLAYDLVNGPSGKGVDDLYNPEIAANDSAATNSVDGAISYDSLKVQAVLNEIDGYDHTGKSKTAVPAIMGMNFQAVSVGQKLAGNGYVDVYGEFSTGLAKSFDFVDQSLGKMVAELNKQGLSSSTMFIISAKHGQDPIDPSKHKIVSSKIIPAIINRAKSGLVAQATLDDIGLIWLSDQSLTGAAVYQLGFPANQQLANISQVLSDDSVRLYFPDPRTDSRSPDIIVIPNQGVIYAGSSATKIAEHGGFSLDDTNVPILVSGPGLGGKIVRSPVQTTQIAPTILKALGLDPQSLQAVQKEGTTVLPGLGM